HEAPLLGLRVRKAVQAGARVLALNPLDFDFDFPVAASHVEAPSKFADAALALAGKGDAAGFDAAGFIEALKSAERAVVIVGEGVELHPRAADLRTAAKQLAESTGARLNRLPQGANAVGLARAGVLPTGLDTRAMLASPRKAYIVYGAEPELDIADTPSLLAALDHGRSVIAFTAYADEALKQLANVILPIGLLPEIDATLDNVDGCSQSVTPATKLPGEARPGWRVLRALGAQLGLAGFEFLDMDGLRDGVASAEVSPVRSDAPIVTKPADGQYERIGTTPIYRGDAVLRRCAALASQALSREPAVMLNATEAKRLGARAGDAIRIDDGRGNATLPLVIDSAVPDGAAWIESKHPATAPLAGNGSALSLTKV
ncbi:MAG: molybdopterin-dependent oxidoreductase, partial [Xanthomonadales bacterium]|nr:molybdopterin-dependent oxidoreductase [Xanthomonadales bacterium]